MSNGIVIGGGVLTIGILSGLDLVVFSCYDQISLMQIIEFKNGSHWRIQAVDSTADGTHHCAVTKLKHDDPDLKACAIRGDRITIMP